jgi:DNA-binding SARP family transcriptional activator/tetratricopeptide (TPR) repeat protein/DNA-binding XRE family transcriptional regulator
MDPGVRDTVLLATLVRGLRQGAGLTQRELAARAGLSLGSVRSLEQGRTRRPGPGSLRALATALALSPAQAGDLERAAAGRGLWLQVLGPLAAWRDGVAVPLGGPAQRAVLGLLALSPGSLVHRAAIIDVLWPDSPPANAVNLVQAHVSRLRKMLASRQVPGHGGLLSSAGASYRLRAGPGQLDLARFGQLIADARAACTTGDYEGGCSPFQQALDLWRGHALADVDLLRGHPEITGLGRRRAEAVIEYARAASAVGWHDRVLAPLRELAGREPLNEQAHAQLMIALAGCGQQAEGLAVYHDLRRRLDDELGMPPGPELAKAHQKVLRQGVPATRVTVTSINAAPATIARRLAAGRSAYGPTVPRQLPAAPPVFTGRDSELSALGRLLDAAADTVVIAAVVGTAGVGKTALAVHWARRFAAQFPDGQLYVNLRGFGPSGTPVTPAEAIRGFLDGLSVAAERIPASVDAQAGLYRSLIADKRLLIVLDNARDVDQVRPLLPGSPGSMVVVTSRASMGGLAVGESAHLVTLGLLTEDEARQLLADRLGTQRAPAEPSTVNELIIQCTGLPLALAIAAARAVGNPELPLSALAAELRDAASRLDGLDAGDAISSIRTVFSWSYRNLRAPVGRMFRLLGIHPGPDITAPAAASLAGIPVPEARRTLRELTAAHLLTEHFPGRYAFHDLLRAYATDQARATDSDADLQAASRRVLDFYLHSAHAAALLLNPSREPITLNPWRPGVTPEHLAGHQQALAWFGAEHQVLLAAVNLAAQGGFDSCAWQLPWAMTTFLDYRGYWHEYAVIQRTALTAATRLGDTTGQATAHRLLAHTCAKAADFPQARAHLAECLELYRKPGDRAGEARTHQTLSLVAERTADYRRALDHAEQALVLLRSIDDHAAQASALNNVGWCHALLGDYQQAQMFCAQALTRHRELGDRHGEAHTWDSLGYAAHKLGNVTEAVACYQHALVIFRDLGDRFYQADTLSHLGDAHLAANDQQKTHKAWQQALGILDGLRHPAADRVRARLSELTTTAR